MCCPSGISFHPSSNWGGLWLVSLSESPLDIFDCRSLGTAKYFVIRVPEWRGDCRQFNTENAHRSSWKMDEEILASKSRLKYSPSTVSRDSAHPVVMSSGLSSVYCDSKMLIAVICICEAVSTSQQEHELPPVYHSSQRKTRSTEQKTEDLPLDDLFGEELVDQLQVVWLW